MSRWLCQEEVRSSNSLSFPITKCTLSERSSLLTVYSLLDEFAKRLKGEKINHSISCYRPLVWRWYLFNKQIDGIATIITINYILHCLWLPCVLYRYNIVYNWCVHLLTRKQTCTCRLYDCCISTVLIQHIAYKYTFVFCNRWQTYQTLAGVIDDIKARIRLD